MIVNCGLTTLTFISIAGITSGGIKHERYSEMSYCSCIKKHVHGTPQRLLPIKLPWYLLLLDQSIIVPFLHISLLESWSCETFVAGNFQAAVCSRVTPKHCSIPSCMSRNDKEECKIVSFHAIPKDIAIYSPPMAFFCEETHYDQWAYTNMQHSLCGRSTYTSLSRACTIKLGKFDKVANLLLNNSTWAVWHCKEFSSITWPTNIAVSCM